MKYYYDNTSRDVCYLPEMCIVDFSESHKYNLPLNSLAVRLTIQV